MLPVFAIESGAVTSYNKMNTAAMAALVLDQVTNIALQMGLKCKYS